MVVDIQHAFARFLRSWAMLTERHSKPPVMSLSGHATDESWRGPKDPYGSSYLAEVPEEREPFDLLGEDW
jgi:hypothetical protein